MELYVFESIGSWIFAFCFPATSNSAIVGLDYFPVFHLELCSRHCLLLKTTPNDNEQHDGSDSNNSQVGPVKFHLLSHRQLCRAGRVFPL